MSNLLSQHGNHLNLQHRIVQRMKLSKVNDRIFEAIQKSLEQAVKTENIIALSQPKENSLLLHNIENNIFLSRSEKDRLLHKVMKSILTDMLAKLDGEK
jgi:hypothetical protein